MTKIIRVAKVNVDTNFLEVDTKFVHSLENMQKAVGGHLEAMVLHSHEGRDVVLWLNEEGKLNGLKPNIGLYANNQLVDIIVGDVLITSSDIEGETTSLNDAELEFIKHKIKFNKTNTGKTLILR